MNKGICRGGFLRGILTGSLVMADCSNTMPEKLLEDCIVYEGAGTSFPPGDYAHMDQYKDWQMTQQPKGLAKATRKERRQHQWRRPAGRRF